MPDDIVLLIDGLEFGGWKRARVGISMEAGSGSFDLEVSERFPLEPARRQIRTGMSCEVRVGGTPRISGHVTEVAIGLTGISHSVNIRGRDRVADLIDCAPDISDPGTYGPLEPGVVRGEWNNISLLELARDLATPFGIKVEVPALLSAEVAKRFEKVTLTPGQRIFDLLEQHCRQRQILPISDGLGNLLLTRAGTARISVPLVEGENILAATATFSEAERFSRYYVKGQSYDSAGTRAESAGEAFGRAEDALVGRLRPLLLIAEQAVDVADCQRRAGWEALTRAARAERIQVDVVGWRQPGGGLWPVNWLIALRSPTLGVDRDLLITEVAYNLPSQITTLQLARPDAFTPPPEVVPADGAVDDEG